MSSDCLAKSVSPSLVFTSWWILTQSGHWFHFTIKISAFGMGASHCIYIFIYNHRRLSRRRDTAGEGEQGEAPTNVVRPALVSSQKKAKWAWVPQKDESTFVPHTHSVFFPLDD